MKKNLDYYGLFKPNSNWHKLLLTMKISAFLLFCCLVNIFAAPTYSQSTKISLNLKDATIEEVLNKIEDMSEFYFLYNNKLIDVKRKVNIEADKEPIKDILNSILPADTKFIVYDRQIILAPSDVAALSSTVQQQLKITGTITDKDGAPIIGANVVVTGTTLGAMTDIAGKYSIGVPPGSKSLTFSFIGMIPQEISIGTLTQIDLTMTESATSLEEVVVIGYGLAKKASVTGSVTTVKGDVIQASHATNFTQALAGRLPGLVVVSTSGNPGKDDATLRIRGVNTLGDNSPLIVIDGVANRNLTRLEPTDIESITVLKDASAAIYGAQAANGVILITTKRGTIGKPEITINSNYGVSKPTVIPKMTDGATYATMLNEMKSYIGQAPSFSAEEIQKFKDGSDPWLYPNVDVFREVFKPSSPQIDASVSIRGGTESLKYFISSGYKYQDGIYRNGACNYSQVDFRTNIDGKISKNISLSLDLAGRQENRNNPFVNENSPVSIFDFYITRTSSYSQVWYPGHKPADGFQFGYNPVILGTNIPGYSHEKTYYFTSNVKLLVTIPWVKNLSITGNVAVDKNVYTNKLWESNYFLYNWDRKTYDENNEPVVVPVLAGPTDSRLTQTLMDGQSIMLNALLNYDFNIAAKHNIKILAGAESISGKSATFTGYRRGYISTALQELFAGGDAFKDATGSSSQSGRLNYFGRFNYDYLQKYLLEFVFRYDGSYIFPAKGRFGFFPGVSAGWKISEEDFWKNNISFINYFKFRGSWGQTGNDRITPYQYLSSYGFGSIPYVFGTVEAKTLNELRIANPEVTWEVANQSNIGFDGQIFGGKLQFSADYFYNLRTNILWFRNASVPVMTGLTLPRENIGKVENQGFEVQVGYQNKIGSFKYAVSVNGAYSKDKILFWDETPGIPDYQRSTGKPMNALLLYKAIGIFKDQAAIEAYPHWVNAAPGDVIFEDVNRDGKIDALDQVRSRASNIPTFTGGLSIDLGYKNIYASLLFQGATGAEKMIYMPGGLWGNYLADDAVDRWTVDNPNGTKPRAWQSNGYYWSETNNTYWLKNCNYLRLRNIQIGYNLPKTIADKLNISELSIYFSGTNLITFTPYKVFDPETTGTVYPLSKVSSLGLKLTF